MPEYQQRKRNAVRRNDEDDTSGGASSIPTSIPSTSRQVSDDAESKISDIDSLLNEEENPDAGFNYRNEDDEGKSTGSEALSRDETAAKQLADGSGSASSAGAAAGAIGAAGLFTGGPAGSRIAGLLGRFTPTKRQGIAGSMIGGGAITGLVLISMLATGPGQLIRYGQMLASITPFQHQQAAGDDRMGKLIRWAKSRDIGQTRLGTLGYLTNKRIQADFAKEGVKVTTDPITGQMRSITIDLAKSAKYAGLSNEQARVQIAADNNVPLDSVRQISNLGGQPKYAFAVTDIKGASKRSVLGGLVADQQLGKVATYNRFRTLKSYYNTENPWLHPWRAAAAAADRKLSIKLRTAAAAADEKSRLKALSDKSSAVKAFNDNIRSKISPGALKTVGGVLIASTAICVAKDVVHSVPEIERANIIVPAIESAGDGLAMAGQSALGKDVTLDQMGATVKSFTAADGTTPWQSSAVQRVDGSSKGGKPVDPELAQAFSGKNNEATIENELNAVGANALCSTFGKIAQGVAGVALLFTGAGGLIEKGVQLAGSAAIGVAIGQLTQTVSHAIADDPITGVPHQGAKGGSVDVLGDLALANSNGIAMGSTQLSPTQSAELDSSVPLNQDFTSQSFASRIFNTHDFRSVAGRVLDSQNPVISQNVMNNTASILTGFTHIGGTFSSLASALFPKAHAAPPTTPYGLGVPEFGFSRQDLSNPLFDDPYANADAAANLFDNDFATGYIAKAMTCFGVTISKDDSGKWGAVGTSDVNTASSDYTSADCNDQSTDWKRVRFFIFDTGLMEGYACDKLDDQQSCADDGWGADGSQQEVAGSPVTASGSAAELAQRLLNDTNLTGGPGLKDDLTAVSQNKPISNTSTCGNSVSIDKNLLQVLLTATLKYKLNLFSIITPHACDQYLHPKGRAADIMTATDIASGKSTNFTPGASGDDQSLDRSFYTYIASIMPKGSELGQDQCAGRTGLTAPPGITFFDDLCTHQHIDLGNP